MAHCDFCALPARFVDPKGYVYCTVHKLPGRGRRLTATELGRLSSGNTIRKY